MDVALFASDVDQLSQLLGECHLHEERDALKQVMMPIASYAGLTSGLPAPYSSATASSGLYADELLRRLQGCQSFDEGRATCAEMMNAFHQDQHCQQLLRPRNVPAPTIPASSATPMEQTAPGSVNANAELMARLQSLQGANRVIVRALRIMSERLREQGQRSRQAEETVEQLKSELQAQGDQLRASERAKALLQSRLEVMLREDLLPPECGRPCT
eukprot:symbB.v1.2.011885.t1/scaffold806.1/size231046/12